MTVDIRPKFIMSAGDVPLPFNIPRWGKGGNSTNMKVSEVLGVTKITARALVDPSEFVGYCSQHARQICSIDTAAHLAQAIAKGMRLSWVNVMIRFPLSMERVSSTFRTVYIELPCGYTATYDSGKSVCSMQISVPVQVKDAHVTTGQLTLTVVEPERKLFFEDLLDHVQKTCQAVIYPVAGADDREKLSGQFGAGMAPKDILEIMKKESMKHGFGKRGSAFLETKDVYSIYAFDYQIKW
jgi:hypothetical protein